MASVVWKDIPGYPYQVSNTGQVRRITKHGYRLLRPRVNKGYLRLQLSKNDVPKSVYVHALVAAAFLGTRPAGLQVNHIDGNSLNNHVTNLEYVTPAANTKHAYALGLIRSRVGERHHNTNLADEQVADIRRAYATGTVTQYSLAAKYGVAQSCISNLVRYRSRKQLSSGGIV